VPFSAAKLQARTPSFGRTELIVDPFAGSCAFVSQAYEMGRRVIRCNLVRFGSTKIAA
jgi:hypothetical protein